MTHIGLRTRYIIGVDSDSSFIEEIVVSTFNDVEDMFNKIKTSARALLLMDWKKGEILKEYHSSI